MDKGPLFIHSYTPRSRLAGLVVGLLIALISDHVACAQPQLMQHRPVLPGFGGLCDGGPLTCPRIDSIAFHAGADATLLPSTSLRSLGFVASYGFSVGILQHVEGGIFSNTAVWGQPSNAGDKQTDTLWQQGPMRFALKGLVWPFIKNPHQSLAVLVDFEYEARLPHFDGQNQLGLLTDLAALRAVGNLPLGLAEVGISVGALWDGAGTYGTSELGARVGFHLPFMTDTKVFAEGVARGVGVWMKAREPTPDSQNSPQQTILPSGALAFGLITRPRRQVDFAMVLHVGFGDVAPFFLTLRGPMDFSLGEGYPYPQSLAVDILREAGEWIAEQLRRLPEPVQQTCLLYGRDGQLITTLGRLTDDAEHCEFQGQRFRIGDTLYLDPARRRVCLEPEATHCVGGPSSADVGPSDSGDSPDTIVLPNPDSLPQASHLDPAMLKRLINQGALGPIQGSLDGRCILNEGDHQVSPIGHVSPDGKHCVVERNVNVFKNGKKVQTTVQQIPISIGQPVYRDPTTGRVCLSRKTNSNRDCPAALDVAHNRPLSSGTEVGYHGALALVDWTQGKADTVKGVAHLLTHPAELTTAGIKAKDRAEQAAKSAVATLKDPNKARQAAHDAWNSSIDVAHGAWEGAVNWYHLPTQKKLDGAAEGGVKAFLDAGATAVVGSVLPVRGTGLTVAEGIRKDVTKGNSAARALEEVAEAKQLSKPLPHRPETRGLLSAPPEPVKPPEAGRFIVDPKGNVVIEPRGGTTGGNAQGSFTITRYSNGSPAYEVHEGHPKTHAKEPHGHWSAPGAGPERKQWGSRLDIHGQPVPTESPAAHWKVHK
ncbi:MAG: hypothetical protein QM758_27550 [Armatimonas sp.]